MNSPTVPMTSKLLIPKAREHTAKALPHAEELDDQEAASVSRKAIVVESAPTKGLLEKIDE